MGCARAHTLTDAGTQRAPVFLRYTWITGSTILGNRDAVPCAFFQVIFLYKS